MTKKLDRVFVEVSFDPENSSYEEVIGLFGNNPDPTRFGVRNQIDRPPAVISDEYICERFAELMVVSSKYSTAFSKRFDDKLHVDPRLMMIAVRSAYDDIARYKLYHLQKPYSDRSDCVKRAAYITKWFAKIKPLQMTQTIPENNEQKIDFRSAPAKASMANVMFALSCSLKYFECELGVKPLIDPKIFHETVYDLTYRDMNIDSMLMLYQLLADRISGNEIISQA